MNEERPSEPGTRPDLGGEPVTVDDIINNPLLTEVADLLAYLDLHLGRYPWTQLTTRQKEVMADLIDNAGTIEQLNNPDEYRPGESPRRVERWWRADFLPAAPLTEEGKAHYPHLR